MKIKNTLSAVSLILVSLGLSVSLSVSTPNVEKYEPTYALSHVDEYYQSITDGMIGNDLLGALHTLNNQKREKTIGYAGLSTAFRYFDADPDGSGKIVGFYDNTLVGPEWDSGNTWNREHVWPNARGGSSVEGDAHMTRPASTKTNSDRGSKGYGVESYDPGQFVAYYRGAASRIIFYAAVADTNLKLVTDPLNYHGGSPANSMGSLYDMLRWNLEYQPQDTSFTGDNDLARRTELNRNEAIENSSHGQGNRNPFIDHPEYACRIWGRTDATTKSICGITDDDTPPTPQIESLVLNSESEELNVGDTFQLSLSITPSDFEMPEVSWDSTKRSVANVDSNGLVTALSAGTAVVSFKTLDNKFSGSCTFTVLEEQEEQYTCTISLDVHDKEIQVGESFELTPTVVTSDGEEVELFWSSENSTIANVNQNGKVKGIGVGETIIKVESMDGKYFDTCLVKVNEKVIDDNPPEPAPSDNTSSKGCGGSIISTSVLLSTISFLGIALISIKKNKKSGDE